MTPLAPVPAPADSSRGRTLLATSLALLCAIATLPFASVRPWAVLGIEIGALLAAIAALLIHRRSPTPLSRSARIAMLLGAGVLIVGALQLIGGTTAPPSTVDALVRFGAYLLLAFAATIAASPGSNLRGAAIVLAAIGAFQGLYGAFEYLSGRQHIFGFAKKFYLDEATGTFINRNHYAGYLAAVLPFALALAVGDSNGGRDHGPSWRGRLERFGGRRALGRIAAGMAAASIWLGVLLSQSRAGLALAGASTLMFAWLASRNRVRWGWILAVGIVPLVFLLVRDVRTPGGGIL